MAGTLPNLPLCQQFDKDTGRLLSGGKLYFFRAGTTQPQNAFQDVGLTLPHPNPITFRPDGRCPSFYVADGFIRVRLTNKAGVVQFDADNQLVIGPSSGGGGGNSGSVDPTAVFRTGDELFLKIQGTRDGWVRQNGRTIGSAVSGSTERANTDTAALYSYLWGNFPDSICAVIGGRGASASSDFSANKQITLPDMRGRVAVGLDGMGNVRANIIPDTNLVGDLTADTAAAIGGEANHALTSAELAPHDHAVNLFDPGHSHTYLGASGNHVTAGSDNLTPNTTASTSATTTGVRVKKSDGTLDKSENSGGGKSHNNMSPFALGAWFIKL
jgi:microcystin-dependent protein